MKYLDNGNIEAQQELHLLALDYLGISDELPMTRLSMYPMDDNLAGKVFEKLSSDRAHTASRFLTNLVLNRSIHTEHVPDFWGSIARVLRAEPFEKIVAALLSEKIIKGNFENE